MLQENRKAICVFADGFSVLWNSGVQLKVKERERFRLNLLNVYLQVADRYAKKIRRHPMQMLINCCSEGDNRGALLLPKKASRQRNKNVALIQPQVKERSCCLLSRYWETCAESIPNQKIIVRGLLSVSSPAA